MTKPPGLLLAGGRSTRMGENKALLPFGPGRLIDHVLNRLSAQCDPVIVNFNGEISGLHGYRIVRDEIPDHAGPLAGIAAGLAHCAAHPSAATHVLTAAVDTPFFPDDLAAALSDGLDAGEIAVATDADGRWHPTFALWPVALAQDLSAWLSDPGNRKLRAFIERHPHRTVAFPLIETHGRFIEPFFNINTPEDYRTALSLADEQA